MPLTLTAISRYPVKSCGGQRVGTAVVEPWGLAGDRRWMVVDETGAVMTAREHPRLVLVTPHLTDDGLILRAPKMSPLAVALPDGSAQVEVCVFSTPVTATPAADAAHEWISELIGQPGRLVYLDDPTRRRPNPRYSRPSDRVSFADGYPLLLATEESLAALNDLIAAGPNAAEAPVPMTRFRPNVVVAGAAAWAEDGWRRIRIGAAAFRVVKGCDRCVLTLIDPATGRSGKEPLATLVRHRRWDGKSWFAVNLIPDSPGARLQVGDPVEVVEQVDADEPLR